MTAASSSTGDLRKVLVAAMGCEDGEYIEAERGSRTAGGGNGPAEEKERGSEKASEAVGTWTNLQK